MIFNKLLSTGLFEDNKYFKIYKNIIINSSQENNISGCQVHHIIPRCVFKLLKLEVDESDQNKVRLLYKDHLRAHYYLYWSCVNPKLKHSLASAFSFIYTNRDLSDEIDLIDLTLIQKLYEEFINARKIEYAGRYGPNTGKIVITDELHEKHVKPEDLDSYLAKSWRIGRKKFSDTDRKHKSEAASGKRSMTKDNLTIAVKLDQIPKYLEEGWELGVSDAWKISHSASHKGASGYKSMNKGDEFIKVSPDCIQDYIEAGYIFKGKCNHSPEIRKEIGRKNKIKNTGKIHVHNSKGDHYMIKPEELNSYLERGFIKGSGIHTPQKPNVWVNKEGKNKRIPPEELSIYIDDGWSHGMLKNLKKAD